MKSKLDVAVCYESVCEFFEHYDYHSSDGWLTEILNENIDEFHWSAQTILE